jgi:D-alanine-D-alanine ligase-like ATP-grasp enzyme
MLDKEWKDLSEYHHEIEWRKYLVNKQDFLDHLTAYPIRYWLRNIIPHIEKDGFPYWIDKYWYYASVWLPNWRSRLLYDCDYGINKNTVIARFFDDKIQCNNILSLHWLKVAKSHMVIKSSSSFVSSTNNKDSAIQFAKTVWFPLIRKPIHGSQWKGVKKIMCEEELIINLNDYETSPWSYWYMIQEFIPWNDYRVIYLDGNIEVAYQRIPAHIIWDWIHTIEELLMDKKQYQKQKDEIKTYLHAHWHNIHDIPDVWKKIIYVATANISTGWSAQIYDQITNDDKEMIQKIANATGARYFWVDILTQWNLSDGIILEVNKMPWTEWISKIIPWFGKQLWKKIRNIIKNDEWIVE